MRNIGEAARLALLVLVAGCDTGTGPDECDPDLRIAVDGGATVRFQWNSDCQESSLSEPYRDRPRGEEGP
ncbi:MAG TPA: hypothetical protein VFZ13_08265 [Gemmatimonadales bacterium]